MMASSKRQKIEGPLRNDSGQEKPHILLAACGSAAAVNFTNLLHCFSEWATVKGVVTTTSLRLIDITNIPSEVTVFTDKSELHCWENLGDPVLHIDLARWAEIMVIAPLSANTLAKIAGGICDNLLTCIVRAWDFKKPLFIAPSMHPLMWTHPLTERHLLTVYRFGANLISPVPHMVDGSRANGNGEMAENSHISSTVRLWYDTKMAISGMGSVAIW